MTEEPKVGETWIGNLSYKEKIILFVGNNVIVVKNEQGDEYNYSKTRWALDHTRKPVKQKRWINIYPSCNSSSPYSTKEEADKWATGDRIACVEVEFVEGQGL